MKFIFLLSLATNIKCNLFSWQYIMQFFHLESINNKKTLWVFDENFNKNNFLLPHLHHYINFIASEEWKKNKNNIYLNWINIKNISIPYNSSRLNNQHHIDKEKRNIIFRGSVRLQDSLFGSVFVYGQYRPYYTFYLSVYIIHIGNIASGIQKDLKIWQHWIFVWRWCANNF